MTTRRALLAGAVGLAAAGAWLRPSLAHRSKSALTLVRWNETTGTLEIDHRLHAHDAEVALQRQDSVSAPDLSQVADRARLTLYCEARFSLIGPDGAAITLRPLGAELIRENVHVYQEGRLTTKPARLAVRNDILRDVFKTQVNQVNIDLAGGDTAQVRTLTFTGDDGVEVADF